MVIGGLPNQWFGGDAAQPWQTPSRPRSRVGAATRVEHSYSFFNAASPCRSQAARMGIDPGGRHGHDARRAATHEIQIRTSNISARATGPAGDRVSPIAPGVRPGRGPWRRLASKDRTNKRDTARSWQARRGLMCIDFRSRSRAAYPGSLQYINWRSAGLSQARDYGSAAGARRPVGTRAAAPRCFARCARESATRRCPARPRRCVGRVHHLGWGVLDPLDRYRLAQKARQGLSW